jgi:hypothetical protein
LPISLIRMVPGRKIAHIEVLHGLDEPTGTTGCFLHRIVELEAFEIPGKCKYMKVRNRKDTYLEAELPPLRVDILLTAWTR